MNEYQQAVKNTLEDFFSAANAFKGQVLDKTKVRQIATYINNLVRRIEQDQIALMGADNLLAAYIEEYGSGLMDTLLGDEEVVDALSDEEEE